MLYALLGSVVVGSLATLWLLWRKSVVEGDLASTQQKLVIANTTAEGWKQSFLNLQKTDQDQIARKDSQILSLQGQNETLLKQLEKSGAPGSLAGVLQERNASVSKAGT